MACGRSGVEGGLPVRDVVDFLVGGGGGASVLFCIGRSFVRGGWTGLLWLGSWWVVEWCAVWL